MSNLIQTVSNFFSSVQPIPAGVYHTQSPAGSMLNERVHLRLDPDRSGILMINAATILHLNPVAAEFAYYWIQGLSPEDTIQKVTSRYRVNATQAAEDYRVFVEKIDTLKSTPDLDPVEFLDFERQTPHAQKLSAPYRLDCALTYRQSPGSDPAFAPIQRVARELTTDEWKVILNKAWQVGIPHVIFTGGEPTLRDDLFELIQCTETNGQICGLLTDGIRLAEAKYLQRLLQTGLDHLMVSLQPENKKSWQAIKNAGKEDLFTTVHLTISQQSQAEIESILQKLAQSAIQAISLSVHSKDQTPLLNFARERAAQLQLKLVWDLPVPYSANNPIEFEIVNEEKTSGAGKTWLYVEPDGDVLPGQGINAVLGNFLSDPWEKIWQPVR